MPPAPEQPTPVTLTDDQRDLLQLAVREGYFEVPRGLSLVDLASLHGVPDREASEQLRRGLGAILQGVDLDG